MLDASFLINLNKISCSKTFIDLAKKNGWHLVLPNKVSSEITAGGQFDVVFLDGIRKGEISICHANPTTFNNFVNRFTNLGDGELEVISIAYDSGVPSQYVIISDDNLAKKRAKEIGIQSSSVIAFMIVANKAGLLSKKQAILYLNTLKRKRFSLKPDVDRAFRSQLV